MARLFFACWPSEDAARELARLAPEVADRTGGRAIPADKIHLTLAFLGEIPVDRVGIAESVAARTRSAAFTLVLDRLGAFRRAGGAWAGASSPDPGLLALQSALAAGLRAEGFALEERPFAPHVTLARRVERALPDEPIEPIRWRVTDFALVRTEPGRGRYTDVRRWALGQTGSPPARG